MSRRPQLNLRLTDEQLLVLEAAVFVRGLRSAQDLVMPIVNELVETLETDPKIKQAAALRDQEVSDKELGAELDRGPSSGPVSGR